MALAKGMRKQNKDKWTKTTPLKGSSGKPRLAFLHKSCLMFLFWACCFALYSSQMQKKSKACSQLAEKIQELEQVKTQALALQEDLMLQIGSQSDPAWIEMILKKRLGVVPEGQIKVYFKKDESY